MRVSFKTRNMENVSRQPSEYGSADVVACQPEYHPHGLFEAKKLKNRYVKWA